MKKRSLKKGTFDTQVFINCPFDKDYDPLFEALIFTILDCGFSPRCAREMHDSGEVRITKIFKIISECRLGIHDLSRIELSPNTSLPRFNMPLELGFFLGAKTFGSGMQKNKACLILDKEKYRYQSFLSDLAGQDISSHNGKVENLISETRKWLVPFSQEIIPGESTISNHYTLFKKELPAICGECDLKQHELTYIDYVYFSGVWIEEQNGSDSL